MPHAQSTADAEPQPPSPPGTQMRMGRFVLLFAVCLAVLFGLMLAPLTVPAVAGFTHALSHFAIQMAYGCNGAHVTILLWAAVLAFPASWMQKAKGLAAGTAAIHAVNLVRFISLFYIGQYNRDWFDFAHLYLWESLMMIDTLAIFWTWAYFVRKPGSAAHAGAR